MLHTQSTTLKVLFAIVFWSQELLNIYLHLIHAVFGGMGSWAHKKSGNCAEGGWKLTLERYALELVEFHRMAQNSNWWPKFTATGGPQLLHLMAMFGNDC